MSQADIALVRRAGDAFARGDIDAAVEALEDTRAAATTAGG